MNFICFSLKTGNIPPERIEFEELEDGVIAGTMNKQKKMSSIPKSRLNVSGSSSPNLFQKKRELEKQMEAKSKVLVNGKHCIVETILILTSFPAAQKEVRALEVMIDTYNKNPSYGDVKKFQNEMNTAKTKLRQLETEMDGLKQELNYVSSSLDDSSRSPSLARSTLTRSKISVSSSVTSDMSVMRNTVEDDDEFPDDDDDDSVNIPAPPPPPLNNSSIPPPPPPPPGPGSQAPLVTGHTFAEAQFDYQGDEDALSIVSGERFLVLEQDHEGWTMVRRINDGAEGFVPSTYISIENS